MIQSFSDYFDEARVSTYTKDVSFKLTDGAYMIAFSYGANDQKVTDFLLMHLDIYGANRVCDIEHVATTRRQGGWTFNRSVTVKRLATINPIITLSLYVNANAARVGFVSLKIIKL
jgi:hypothetical protein